MRSSKNYILLQLFIILFFVHFTSPAKSSPASHLCPLSDQTPCGFGLPPEFCCSTDQTCIGLAGNTTVICCPAGGNCSAINPISCNIQLQNVTLHPDSAVKTTALNLGLIKCGDLCCPFGFTCESSRICVASLTQTSMPDEVNPLDSSSSILSTPTLVPTSSTSGLESMSPLNQKVCDKLPMRAVLTGFFPGLIFGFFVSTLLCYILISYQRKKRKVINGYSKFGYISDPQPVVIRSDFLRRQISQVSRKHSIDTSTNDYSLNQMAYMYHRPSIPDLHEELETPLPPVPLIIRKSIPEEKISTDTSQLQQRLSNYDIDFDAFSNTI